MFTICDNMSAAKIVEKSNMIEEAILTEDIVKHKNQENNNDVDRRKSKSSDYKPSISLQTSKKKDQKGSNYHLDRTVLA